MESGSDIVKQIFIKITGNCNKGDWKASTLYSVS